MAPASQIHTADAQPPHSTQHAKSRESISSSDGSNEDSSGSDTDQDHKEEVVIKKRKKALKVTFRKRASRKKLKSSAVLEPFMHHSAWHIRNGAIYTNWEHVILTGLKAEQGKFGSLTQQEFAEKHKKALSAYDDLRAAIPTFDDDIKVIARDPAYLDRLCKTMVTAAGTARSNDISSLKKDALTYAALCLPDGRLDPPINPNDSKKTTRGFKHPQLGALLVPAACFEQYQNDPEYRRNLSLNKVVIKAKAMPHLVYPYGKYDPEHVLEGMFMAPALVAVFQHIFMSPSSALKTPGITRTGHGKARKHHMKSVTIPSIAYACTHYRYAISGCMDWRQNDRHFNYEEFYMEVVKMLEWARENDPEWWKDFVTWWNAQVFPVEDDSVTESSSSDEEMTTSTFKKMKAQVKASRAARDIPANSAPPPPPPSQYQREMLSPSPPLSLRPVQSPAPGSSIPPSVGIPGRQHHAQYLAGPVDANIDPRLQIPGPHVASNHPPLGGPSRYPAGVPLFYNSSHPIASASTPAPALSRGHPTPRALSSSVYTQQFNNSPEWQLENTYDESYFADHTRKKNHIGHRHPSVGPQMNPVFPDITNW
ncbi:hypothetical protein JR316_0004757 [Psilocybe cubensis]|uniref:Uncharacterized protein n=3 Tax=Psilocybe cubensis TaxID=181762 RepID=A0A8H8CLP0_PSICU|nr:hypothetical protein JR316_0010121 [Psilocybe cubensis]XP_047750282.1 hypothetical protein JR316_0004757 [Psilocybe cubensis]KAH9477889.1 hypothetical protein JR316_0010121 [Psilocybe cubensis]KAH9482657.1 hypothetical protein JR316_0004757 [Psilocybe cubensis]